MVRWLVPSFGAGRLVVQILLLVILVMTVYLVVIWLGSGLNGPSAPTT